MATTPAVAHRIRTAGRGTAAAPASAPPTRLREASRMPLPKPSYADPGSPPARRRSAAWEVVRHRASRIWQQNLLGSSRIRCRPLEGLFRPTSPPGLPLLHTAFNDPDTGRHPPEFSFVAVPDAVPESAVGGIAKILALNAAMEASGHVCGALASLFAVEGEPRLSCLVIDSTLTGAQKAAPSLGLPTVVLHTGNTTCFRLFRSYDMLQDKGYLPATGLKKCRKSCRLRWLNYLRPNIKHGDFTEEEEHIICSLYISNGSSNCSSSSPSLLAMGKGGTGSTRWRSTMLQ